MNPPACDVALAAGLFSQHRCEPDGAVGATGTKPL